MLCCTVGDEKPEEKGKSDPIMTDDDMSFTAYAL